jgi:hypothetical protein
VTHKAAAGWLALTTALGLAIDAAVARWHPASTAVGSESAVIAALLAFAAAAFGISAYERTRGGGA